MIPRLTDQRATCNRPNAPHWPICGWWTVYGIVNGQHLAKIGFVLGRGPAYHPKEMARLSADALRPTDWKGNIINVDAIQD